MFIIRILRYLKGYVRFTAKGAYVERFLNLLARGGITVWDGRKSKDVFTGCTTVSSYKRIRPMVRKTGVRVRVQERHGMSFKLRQYKRRKGVFVGLALFAAIVGVMSLFIWDIEVVGNDEISTAAITKRLDELGVHKGSLRSSVDVRDVEQKMRLSFDKLSWIAVNLRGSTATIEIKERVMPPEAIDNGKPCNIIAAKSGQIKYMEVYDGQCFAVLGDTVKKGDVIVSGVIEDKTQHTYFKQARARIVAQTSDTYRIEVPLESKLQTVSEDSFRTMHYRIGGVSLPLRFNKKIPEGSQIHESIGSLRLLGIELPGNVVTKTVYVPEERTVTIDVKRAKQIAVGRMLQFEGKLKSDGGKILDKRTSGAAYNGAYILQADYVTEENIAVPQEILLDNQ